MFRTGLDYWRYATNGGTAFVVRHHGKYFGITCSHVLRGFDYEQLALANARVGDRSAGMRAVFVPTAPMGAAEGSDVMDIALIEFGEESTAEFFGDNAYILDRATSGISRVNDNLLVSGALKGPSSIDEDVISPVYTLLEFKDIGRHATDVTLRAGEAAFNVPNLDSLTGLSGAPVFNFSQRRLCGVVVRAGLRDDGYATLWYVDIQNVLPMLEGIAAGRTHASYNARVAGEVAHQRATAVGTENGEAD